MSGVPDKQTLIEGEIGNAAQRTQQFTSQQQSSQFTQFITSQQQSFEQPQLFEQPQSFGQQSFESFVESSQLVCFTCTKQLQKQYTCPPYAEVAAIRLE